MKGGEVMLHNRIKQLCSRDGITITELERMLGIGNGTIHNWDTKNPTLGKVIMVAKHFGVGVDYLLSDEDLPSKETMEIATRLDGYTEDQKNLVRCYMSLIENGKVG